MNTKKFLKIVCSTLVASSLLFTACKKESTRFKESSNYDENVKNVMINAKLINEYTLEDIQTYTEESQRLIFDEMTSENKARIVKERLDLAISLETQSVNINNIATLKSMINPLVYSENANVNDKIVIENFVESLIPSMGYEKIKGIVTTWGTTGSYITSSTGGAGTTNAESTVKCNCSKSDDWCTGVGSCGNIVCTGKAWGCGTLFMNSCDGKCTLGL